MEVLRLMASKASEVRLKMGHEITSQDWMRELREPEFNGLADAICKGERQGFFDGWLSLRNVTAIYLASCKVNDWKKIFGCLNFDIARKRRKGSLMGDIQIICHNFPGLDPMTIQDEWPMERLLDFIEAMNLASAEEEPEPMSITALGMIPGIEVIH